MSKTTAVQQQNILWPWCSFAFHVRHYLLSFNDEQLNDNVIFTGQYNYFNLIFNAKGGRGGAVVEVLRYKPEGRVIDSRWCHWFHWHNPSGRTMVLGSTQSLTEMSSGNISWG
jgi:hypothetical protein